MHALEAKTCENRRFLGRFQKNLVVWKHKDMEEAGLDKTEFQKDLIVWKRFEARRKHKEKNKFQKDLIVWKQDILKHSLLKTLGVSEGLNSVETLMI